MGCRRLAPAQTMAPMSQRLRSRQADAFGCHSLSRLVGLLRENKTAKSNGEKGHKIGFRKVN
jgi:hypothetical protein